MGEDIHFLQEERNFFLPGQILILPMARAGLAVPTQARATYCSLEIGQPQRGSIRLRLQFANWAVCLDLDLDPDWSKTFLCT